MPRTQWKILAGAAVLGASALGGAALASGAASTSHSALATTTTAPSTTTTNRTPETPLSGDVLAKVTTAAVAKVGGAVDSATTENDSSDSNAAYEAHVTKTDGSHVTVILDANYNVLSIETGGPPGGHGPAGPGGYGPGNGETALTGDTAAKAKAAAVAKTGGTADSATTENDSSNGAAAYEVHVTKTDGSHVTVILDKDFAVLNVEPHAAPPFQHASGH